LGITVVHQHLLNMNNVSIIFYSLH